jgi:hypothetical protein
MKMKNFYIFLIPLLILTLFSCKKKENQQTLTPSKIETLQAAATGGSVVSNQMQTFLLKTINIAADSGHNFFFPNGGKFKMTKSVSAITDGNWTGPDASGWYSLYYTSGEYNYYEKLHLGDTIQYILDMSYSGSEGTFDNKTTAEYIKDTSTGKTTYDGSYIWDVQNSGYNEISHWDWRIYFIHWNPSTGAGTFDWYWGVYENNGGNPVPYHRFEHLEVTETTPSGWLHCLAIFYDDSGTETWRFEFDTPWSPVDMPTIPGWS